MNRLKFIILNISCLILLNGCGMAVKNVVGTVRGGENDILIIEPLKSLESYKSIGLVAIKGSVNERLTPQLLSYLNRKMYKLLSKSGAEVKKKGQLRLSCKVLNIANSFRKKEILVQVQLHDAKTKQSLGIVNIAGEASGFRGIESAADKVAEGVTELLAKHHYPGIKDSSWF